MKKLFIALTFLGFMATANASTVVPNPTTTVATTSVQDMDDNAAAESASFTQELKKRFIEGGPGFMGDCIDLFNFRSCHRNRAYHFLELSNNEY